MAATTYNEYYDKLYAAKDYDSEVKTLLRLFDDLYAAPVRRVLDVGCGTGRHARALAAAGMEIVGVDRDTGAIEIARNHASEVSPKPKFLVGSVSDVHESNFDAAVSLFNVINYIMDVRALLDFFGAIHDRLRPSAPFIFDCWNGIAVVLSPPSRKVAETICGVETITAETLPVVNLLSQRVELTTRVRVHADGAPRHDFPHRYQHRLWMPQDLKDLLAIAGFEVLSLSSWARPSVPAESETWKVLFACRRA